MTTDADPTRPSALAPRADGPIAADAGAGAAGAAQALLASPLGALLDALLPAGVVGEIVAVLDRAVAAETAARAAVAEDRRALVARAEDERARADSAEARLTASAAETADLRSRLDAAEAETARLSDRLAQVRALLGEVAARVDAAVDVIDPPARTAVQTLALAQEPAVAPADGGAPIAHPSGEPERSRAPAVDQRPAAAPCRPGAPGDAPGRLSRSRPVPVAGARPTERREKP